MKNPWKKNGGSYADLFSISDFDLSPYSKVVVPAVVAAVEKYTKKGDAVLDVGCGEGYLSREIHKLKRKTFGFDISSELIDVAKDKNKQIEYSINDLESEMPGYKRKFSLITANLVFMYLKNVDKSLKNIRTVLKAGGHLMVLIPHPCYYLKTNIGWFNENDSKLLSIDDYFSGNGFFQRIGNRYHTDFYHRTLGFYINLFVRNGFTLVDFIEPKSRITSTFLLKKAAKIPFVCLFILKKAD